MFNVVLFWFSDAVHLRSNSKLVSTKCAPKDAHCTRHVGRRTSVIRQRRTAMVRYSFLSLFISLESFDFLPSRVTKFEEEFTALFAQSHGDDTNDRNRT